MSGYLGNANTDNQNAGQKTLMSMNGKDLNKQKECLRRCKAVEAATGCELYESGTSFVCSAHTQSVTKSTPSDCCFSWIFSNCYEGNNILQILSW